MNVIVSGNVCDGDEPTSSTGSSAEMYNPIGMVNLLASSGESMLDAVR